MSTNTNNNNDTTSSNYDSTDTTGTDYCNTKVTYQGAYQNNIKLLLDKFTDWCTPSTLNANDGKAPVVATDPNCLRDQYIAAAIHYAWLAEGFYRLNQYADAESNAMLTQDRLDKADSICNAIGATGTCQTYVIWHCTTIVDTTQNTDTSLAGKIVGTYAGNGKMSNQSNLGNSSDGWEQYIISGAATTTVAKINDTTIQMTVSITSGPTFATSIHLKYMPTLNTIASGGYFSYYIATKTIVYKYISPLIVGTNFTTISVNDYLYYTYPYGMPDDKLIM